MKKIIFKYTVDCTHAVKDGITGAANFEKYLKECIEVDGKTGNFGNNVFLGLQTNNINLTSKVPLSKNSWEYLTKKYLNKNNVCDW